MLTVVRAGTESEAGDAGSDSGTALPPEGLQVLEQGSPTAHSTKLIGRGSARLGCARHREQSVAAECVQDLGYYPVATFGTL